VEIFLFAVIILIGLAISGLIVGVSNDAVNFLNSSFGSKVAPRHVVLIIASLGILAGVTFSSGMMEVARKGIFHPQFFSMPELMVLFLAVMLTNIFLLDLYNTFGLPTSTTVSIVFGLLGAAVAVSLIKISQNGDSFSSLVNYINTGKALAIIFGILLSVIVAFFLGAFVQFITRLIFTFDFQKRLKRYGAVWGGIAMTAIIYFILIKGSKGASFISDEILSWIQSHTLLILLISFLVCGLIMQIFLLFTRISILKIIILIGTFALAMAFAANDLVNFIGLPLAGLNAFQIAQSSSNGLNQTMEALQQPIRSDTLILLFAGAIMVITLWLSRKSRTVCKTEIDLGRQDEGVERFGSSPLSRTLVRMTASLFEFNKKIIPKKWQKRISQRLDDKHYHSHSSQEDEMQSFDLLRASVNLMMASVLISFATSLKLPLSTTYVTFMVSMGTSLSDRAWGRESAVYRITGVLTVIGGWFFTALMAFTVSFVIAVIVFFWEGIGVIGILTLVALLIIRSHRLHRSREIEEQALDVFNLRKITDTRSSIITSFEHTGMFLQKVKDALNVSYDGLFTLDRQKLKGRKKESKKIQTWANIIVANIFKILRLLQKESVEDTERYAQTISTLQEIAESQRDIFMRAYSHVDNNHMGLLNVQIEELAQIKACVVDILEKTSNAFLKKEKLDYETILADNQRLKRLSTQFNQNQIKRIQDESSKTRLSILFYGFMWDSLKIAEQTFSLLDIFHNIFKSEGEKIPWNQNDVP